jgi:hypothetical protein
MKHNPLQPYFISTIPTFTSIPIHLHASITAPYAKRVMFTHVHTQKETSQAQKNYDALKKRAPKADFDCKGLLSAERLLEIVTKAVTQYPGSALLECLIVFV